MLKNMQNKQIALLVLPSLLSAPVIKGSRDDDGVKRRASWRPSNVEMMQAFVMHVPVRMSENTNASILAQLKK
jgi:hypothetical protein